MAKDDKSTSICRYNNSADVGRYASHHGVSAATVLYKKAWFTRKHGRCFKKAWLLLGNELDEIVRAYVFNLREGGGVVSARIVVAAARGIIKAYDKSKLGDHIRLNRPCANSCLQWMNFVQ